MTQVSPPPAAALPTLTSLTSDLYAWSYRVIQSRAFGRRLPWSSLVPLADCLNHSNTSARYSLTNATHLDSFTFEPSYSNVFTLTLASSTPSHSEIYNSYGRLSNRSLLLDYGFCTLNNEWEYIPLPLRLKTYCQESVTPSGVAQSSVKKALRRLGLNSSYAFRLSWNNWEEGLLFFSCVFFTAEECEAAVTKGEGYEPAVKKEAVESYMRLIFAASAGEPPEVADSERTRISKDYVETRASILESARLKCLKVLDDAV